MRRRLALLVTTTVVLVTHPAHADAHAEAVTFFEAGRSMRDQNNCAEALPLFKKSIDRERSVGGYFNVGLCSQQLGLYAEAYAAFQESVRIAEANKEARAQEGKDAMKALLAKTNWVLLQVPDNVARKPGLEIRFDGHKVPPERYNTHVFGPLASHDLRVKIAGRAETSIPAPNRQTVIVDVSDDGPLEPVAPAPAPAPSPSSPPPSAEEPASSGTSWPTQKWVGLGFVGAGLVSGAVAAVVGIGYGLEYSSLRSDIQKGACDLDPKNKSIVRCSNGIDGADVRSRNDALVEREKTAVPVTIIAGAAGAVLLGVGAYLFFSAPDPSKPSAGKLVIVPSAGTDRASLSISGTF